MTQVLASMTDKAKPEDKAVKIERLIAERAQTVSKAKGITIREYLSDMVREQVNRDYTVTLQKLQEDLEREKKRKVKE